MPPTLKRVGGCVFKSMFLPPSSTFSGKTFLAWSNYFPVNQGYNGMIWDQNAFFLYFLLDSLEDLSPSPTTRFTSSVDRGGYGLAWVTLSWGRHFSVRCISICMLYWHKSTFNVGTLLTVKRPFRFRVT